MPNHVTTTCTVIGSPADVARFTATHLVGRDASHLFDFNTIIPMPKELGGTQSGTASELGFYALTGLADQKYGFQTPPLHFPWVIELGIRTAKEFREYLERERPDHIEEGKRALAAFRATGFTDWYEWSIENWGTKWNAYDYAPVSSEPGCLVFRFETAWSFPEPVFRKLAEMYPEVVLSIASYDEGSNFACEGSFNGANDYRTMECTPELYERAYGRPQETDEEDGA